MSAPLPDGVNLIFSAAAPFGTSTSSRTKLASEPVCGNSGDERLLPEAHAVPVDVLRVQDRVVAAVQPRRREAREAGAVALAPVDADVERELRAVGAIRDELAAVGEVERDRAAAVHAVRLAEREVVDAGVGQRPGHRRPGGQQQRLQEGVGSPVGGPAGAAEERVAPEIRSGPGRLLDMAHVVGAEPERRAGCHFRPAPARARSRSYDRRSEKSRDCEKLPLPTHVSALVKVSRSPAVDAVPAAVELEDPHRRP